VKLIIKIYTFNSSPPINVKIRAPTLIANLDGKQSENRANSMINNAQERKEAGLEIDNVVFDGGKLLGKIDTVTGTVDLRVQSSNRRIH
jgi:hypothetical protein